jgi:4-amino-4-deoxy-L-arabinose transferase-like glycosyltransferase
MTLWFDTHSQYYPFNGELLPLEDLDYEIHQQYWLPLFTGLTWIYSLLGVIGGWLLWRSRDRDARRWLLLVVLLIFLRLGFFATLENPEPRYTVEMFPFLIVLASAVARWSMAKSKTRAATEAAPTVRSEVSNFAPPSW